MSWRGNIGRNRKWKRWLKLSFHGRGVMAWQEEETGRVRVMKNFGPGSKKYLRQLTNRKVRRELEVSSGGAFKRRQEFWWALW